MYRAGWVGRVGRKDRGPAARDGTWSARGLWVALGERTEVLRRSRRAPSALRVRAHRVDGGVPLLLAESAGFVRTVAHGVRQRWVVLAVCEEGESEAEK